MDRHIDSGDVIVKFHKTDLKASCSIQVVCFIRHLLNGIYNVLIYTVHREKR